MRLILSICSIALTIGITSGGVVREDDIMDMVQGIFSNPDDYASSLGMARVKRSNWDKEFTLEKLGLSFRIKYKDPSDKLQGGNAEIELKKFRKFMKGIPLKTAKFIVTADAAGKFGDGLFKINIDYELSFLFGGQDSGRVQYERKMDGKFYQANFEFLSNSENNPDRPPSVKVDLKSDYKTKATGRFFFDDHKNKAVESTWEIDLINKEVFKGVFKGEKTYSFEGKFNKGEKKVDLIVDLDGKKYNGFADIDCYSGQCLVKINFDFGPAGKFDFNFNANKDMSDAGIKIFLNDKDILTAKLFGVLDQAPRLFKYEARYSGMFVKDSKVRVSYERFKKLKLQYLPKVGQTFDMKCELDDDKTLTFEATANKDEKKTFEVKTKSSLVNDANTLGFSSRVDWFIKGRGPFYRFFYNMNCLQCLNSFKYESNLAVERNKLYKFDFDIAHLEDDGSSHKEVYITTKDKYYAFFSKGFLSELEQMIFSYSKKGRKDLELEGKWNPGKSFKITSNRDFFQLFLVENIDGYMRKFEFNGEELMKAGWKKNGKQVKLTVELPDGHKMDSEVEWRSNQILSNNVQMFVNGPSEQITDLVLNWNFEDHDKHLTFDVSGENELMGKFNIERHLTFSYENYKKFNNRLNSLEMNIKSKTNITNTPIPTDLETEFDFEASPLHANYYFMFEGERYALECDYGSCFRPLDDIRRKTIKKAVKFIINGMYYIFDMMDRYTR